MKDKISEFELKLLKADAEHDSTFLNSTNLSGREKLIEIQNDFILYRKEILCQSVGGLNIYQITIN